MAGNVLPPETVAPAFVFLASNDSDDITGQVLAFNRNETAARPSSGRAN